MRAAGLHNLVAMVRGLDVDAVDGAAAPPYALPNFRVEYVRQEPPGIPTAFWRGVGPTHNIFVVESFIDELAVIAKQDPFEYRRALLDKSPRQGGPRARRGTGRLGEATSAPQRSWHCALARVRRDLHRRSCRGVSLKRG